MANFVAGIISLTISVIVLTTVFIPQVTSTNTTNWSTGDAAMFAAVTTIALAGFLYGIASVFGLV